MHTSNTLRLRKSYKEFSAGTLFVPISSKTEDGTEFLKVKALSPMLRSKKSAETHKPELMIPIGYLDEYKSHTHYEQPREAQSENLKGGYANARAGSQVS